MVGVVVVVVVAMVVVVVTTTTTTFARAMTAWEDSERDDIQEDLRMETVVFWGLAAGKWWYGIGWVWH